MRTFSTLISLFLTCIAFAQTPVLVKDINPGAAYGFPNNKEYLIAIGNVVYFAANDGIHGSEVWRSDGSEAGTHMVKDIQPGSTGSAPIRFNVLGNKILFIANDGTHGDELWSSDGTEAGTVLVKDINSGTGHVIRRNYVPQQRDRRVVNGILYFAADTGTKYSQLWRSDGTDLGTFLVSDVCPICNTNNFYTGEFAVLHDTLYIVAGGDLWRSDGTTVGTQLVVDNLDADGPGIIRHLTGVNDLLYMSGGHDSFNLDFWVSDGTKAGTKMLKDLPDTGTPHQFTALGGQVFFISDENLWSTDGTQAGTLQESSLAVENIFFRRSRLFLWNSELYYRAQATDNQSYLYKTDGVPAGEQQVFTQNYQGTSFNDPLFVATTNDFLYYDAVSQNPLAAGIGRINSSGTVKEIIPVLNSSLVEYLFVAGDNLFFRGSGNATGQELWKLPLVTSAAPELSNRLSLHIYPTFSPEGVFFLDHSGEPASNFKVSVFDALGRLSYLGTHASGEPLRLSALPAGAYIVHIAAENGQSVVQKVIIGQ